MRLVIIILIVFSAVGAQRAIGCACCLPEGVWGTYALTLHDHLYKQAVGVAMENAAYPGRVALGPEYQAEELYEKLQLQYGDSCFALQSSDGVVFAKIVLEKEVEGFMADLEDGATIYREWRFVGSVDVVSDVWMPYLGNKAKIILQGHYNGCFDPSGMTHWIIRFSDSEDSRFNVVMHGKVEMNMQIWERALKARTGIE